MAANIGLSGTWERANIVIIGDVHNTGSLGEQMVRSVPAPVDPSINRLYWCKGELITRSVLRGNISPGARTFVWAAIRPGCSLDRFGFGIPTAADVSQVWFLREEKGILRPVVDAGGVYYLAFKGPWAQHATSDLGTAIGAILLDPQRISSSANEFAVSFGSIANAACSIMGMDRCRNAIRDLSVNTNSVDVQAAARTFLRANP
jgi:hypothetical protein